MRWLAAVGLGAALAACGDAGDAAPPAPAGDAAADFELRDAGLATPESALHDPVADVYLVSNISGDPFSADGDGFVSRIAPDGSVVALKWIAGGVSGAVLNAPKGMALHGDHLWVADIDHVRRFDRATGAPAGAVQIDGATFLNDVAVGPDGAIYVTDTGLAPGFEPSGTDAVWRIGEDLTAAPYVESRDLGEPNGIAGTDRDLFVVTWQAGVFALVTPAGLSASVELPTAQLDGVVRVGDGRFLVSSWVGGCVYELSPTGSATVVVDGLEAPADIGFDARRGRLLIPLFTTDRLLVRRL